MIERVETTIDVGELNVDSTNNSTSQDLIRVVITNEQGERAIGFLTVAVRNGRVQFGLTAKKSKAPWETTRTAVADWTL